MEEFVFHMVQSRFKVFVLFLFLSMGLDCKGCQGQHEEMSLSSGLRTGECLERQVCRCMWKREIL